MSSSVSAHPERSLLPPSRRRTVIIVRLAVLALTASLLAMPATANASRSGQPLPGKAPANATSKASHGRIFLGAVGNAPSLSKKISHRLARHEYRDFNSATPDGRMVTANTGYTWPQVAAMQPGSALYADVVRWAHDLKRRHRTTLFSFSHEPEITSKIVKGNASDFKRAFRKVVTVFRSQHVHNVKFVWQMTGWSFRVDPTNRMWANNWYPGDKYVDVVGPDEYNWFTCGEGVGNWMSLGRMVTPALKFAKRHHKKFAIPEFASFTNGRRAAWIKTAHRYLARHSDRIMAAFYFQHPPTNPANKDCRWQLSRHKEFKVFGKMARDSKFFRR